MYSVNVIHFENNKSSVPLAKYVFASGKMKIDFQIGSSRKIWEIWKLKLLPSFPG